MPAVKYCIWEYISSCMQRLRSEVCYKGGSIAAETAGQAPRFDTQLVTNDNIAYRTARVINVTDGLRRSSISAVQLVSDDQDLHTQRHV